MPRIRQPQPRGSTRISRPVLVAALVLPFSCGERPINLNLHACDAGDCLSDYTCHPELDLCVPEITIDCTDTEAVCPSRVVTGSPCAAEGAFISCEPPADNCINGCRTCNSGAWSECSTPACSASTPEICNNIDDNCNGIIDDAPSGAEGCIDFYPDADGDGHGDPTDSACFCSPAVGYVTQIDDDCDDNDVLSYAGATEICDGNDNDCDGSVPADEQDSDGDGWVTCAGWSDPQGDNPLVNGGADCLPGDAAVNPGQLESSAAAGTCSDGLDNDCDTVVDGLEPDCAGPAWWNAAWTRRLRVTVDNSSENEAFTDFPVLVIVTAPPVDYGQTQGSGEDVRFVDADGTTLLDHEIESWNESGSSFVWVRLPTLGASAVQTVWMYYGNTGASARPVGVAQSVWQNGYAAVWHFNESSGTHADVSGNGNTASTVGSPTQDATGRIGGAVGFNEDGSHSDSLRADHDTSLAGYSTMTVEAWIFPLDNDEQQQRILQKRIDTNGAVYGLFYADPAANPHPPTIEFRITSSTDMDSALSAGRAGINAWSWVGVTFDTSTSSGAFHINGSAAETFTLRTTPNWTVQQQLDIGGIQSRNNRGFRGTIDEVRISNTARTPAWMRAQYRSMTGAMTSLGVEETP